MARLAATVVGGGAENPPEGYTRVPVPVVDAPVEAEVERAEVAALPHHLHHRLVVELGNVSQVQNVQVPQLQQEQNTHTHIKEKGIIHPGFIYLISQPRRCGWFPAG